jgi:squalene-hopene cyclase-like protein/prenyltransferase/squalene oxidase-like repeat protein
VSAGIAVAATDIAAAAAELVGGLLAEPWGRTSASVYETGRVVSLAPWLTGHQARLRYLLDTQRPDGGWGPADPGYALVPTLSATEALLSALPSASMDAELRTAAGRGLTLLSRWLARPAFGVPDLPAVEHITPALIAQLNERRPGSEPLRPPGGMAGELLPLIRSRLTAGDPVPLKLRHALEIAGPAACRAPAVRPAPTGTVGASPAATAAWLGGAGPGTGSNAPAATGTTGALRYLEAAAGRHGGPVSCAVPITVFERGWVLGWLARAGVPLDVPDALVEELRSALGPSGAATAAGLPADADTTAGALYALSLLGHPVRPDMLSEYETGTHFATWPGEDGSSVSTNAHVLEALGHYRELRPAEGERYRPAVRKTTRWLLDRQHADGSWTDRWHASPYYATFCCASALARFGGVEALPALGRAVGWVLDTQRPDGSWGRWSGTAEETAYAVQTLLALGVPDGRRAAAVVRARDLLLRAATRPAEMDNPPLWHDKDLYLPITIVQAAVLATVYLLPSVTIVSGA